MEVDSEKAISFLKRYAPQGPWFLIAFSLDKKSIDSGVFGPNTEDKCRDYLARYNGERNIYFTVNRIFNASFKKQNFKKPKKEDIQEAGWLHVDVDPLEGRDLETERARILKSLTTDLPKGLPKPTAIIFSGGGYQAFWRLKEPYKIDGNVQNAEEFELYNRRIEQIFDGDNCHNVDRIMRLPGTMNIPDAKKRKKGRIPTLAKLLDYNDAAYDITDFQKATPVQQGGLASDVSSNIDIPDGNIVRVEDVSELDAYEVPERLKVIMVQGEHPEQPKQGDNSRSAWLFDFLCGMVRNGVPDAMIYSIITDPEWLISESVVEKKSGMDRYARRQISRAKAFVEDPIMTKMNDQHAVIGNVGGKCLVIEEQDDPVLERSKLTFSSFESFRNRYMHQRVKVGVTNEGKDVTKPVGEYWLKNPKRRQYDRISFAPNRELEGVYNLWRGFAYEAKPGDCSLYLDHIFNNICGGIQENYDYVIGWMARAVQQPATQGEVALVLRGGKGTGKGTFATIFGKLFGRHHIQISNAKHLVGNFNAHLKDAVSLFADEAFFAGDKQHEGVLKALITEDTIPIEHKGLDLEQYANYVHLIMASNDPHVIRATGDERRYMVLEMGEEHKQDTDYFDAIWKQMENGGYEGLLYYLQTYDLSNFNVRKVPQTTALREQKLLSMGQDEEWWYQKLEAGRILETHSEWQRYVPTNLIEEDFTRYADAWKFNRRGNATQLGKFLQRVVPHIEKTQRRMMVEVQGADGRPEMVSRRSYVYDFGDLEQCRLAWDKMYGETDWSDPVAVKDDDPTEPPF